MKDYLTKENLVDLIQKLADDVIAAKDQLTQLDAILGDGDLGVTLTLGFTAVKESLAKPGPLTPQQVLRCAGEAFANKAASTFGTLMATMFMRAGSAVREKEVIGPAEIAAMLGAAVEGVQKRGKAKQGEKTVLDALIPAAGAAERAAEEGKTLAGCLDAALAGAKQGAEDTVNMRAEAGRSSWFKERSVGVKDPGAAALVVMLESVTRNLKRMTEGG